ncbi:hypothetical protein CXF83_21830 [Shewanella sp. Choline-02u-19]|jgi:hypothetical protein|uniref:hypothetical protein n=1 Tax=unclassified Shewanella TaxID=196818 RepID=UPI000C332669|nr:MULTISPECIES: hypothetical protein [unclassified Shewanella]PKH59331.1 hypothetical protein CXF84_03530 [Shewanella sp. Bg11-22]PKI29158.1 hypothetical protein CXF83_21830 [Shewanella sp. Choline-02u-19]
MAKFNTESASVAGQKSKRGKAKSVVIESLDAEELTLNALSGIYGSVTQRQVIMLLIHHQLKLQERLDKQRIDEENMISSSYLKHLNRSEIEDLMGESQQC